MSGHRPIAAAILLAALSLLSAGNASACSDTEKAGWLCILDTVGYPECAKAKAHMAMRALRGKPPLPPFGSCSGGGDQGYGVQYGIAAQIGVTPPHYVLGTRCVQRSGNDATNNYSNPGNMHPRGCVGTVRYFVATQYGRAIGPPSYTPIE